MGAAKRNPQSVKLAKALRAASKDLDLPVPTLLQAIKCGDDQITDVICDYWEWYGGNGACEAVSSSHLQSSPYRYVLGDCMPRRKNSALLNLLNEPRRSEKVGFYHFKDGTVINLGVIGENDQNLRKQTDRLEKNSTIFDQPLRFKSLSVADARKVKGAVTVNQYLKGTTKMPRRKNNPRTFSVEVKGGMKTWKGKEPYYLVVTEYAPAGGRKYLIHGFSQTFRTQAEAKKAATALRAEIKRRQAVPPRTWKHKSNPRKRNSGSYGLLKYQVWMTKDGNRWVVHSHDNWSDFAEVEEMYFTSKKRAMAYKRQQENLRVGLGGAVNPRKQKNPGCRDGQGFVPTPECRGQQQDILLFFHEMKRSDPKFTLKDAWEISKGNKPVTKLSKKTLAKAKRDAPVAEQTVLAFNPRKRKSNPYKPGGGLLRAGDRGEVRGATRAAQDYAHAFNTAAYKLRGFYPSDFINEKTIEDVQRMVHHFNAQYVRMMEHGVSPAITADALTNQWWDHLSDKAKSNPRKRKNPDKDEKYAQLFRDLADKRIKTIQLDMKGVMGGGTDGFRTFKRGRIGKPKRWSGGRKGPFTRVSLSIIPINAQGKPIKRGAGAAYKLWLSEYDDGTAGVSASVGDMGIMIVGMKSNSRSNPRKRKNPTPVGKAQKFIYAYAQKRPKGFMLTDITYRDARMHFGTLMKGASALAKKGLIDFDGAYVTPRKRKNYGEPMPYTDAELLAYLKGTKGGITVRDLTYAFGGQSSYHTSRLRKLVKAGKIKAKKAYGQKITHYL